jgi:uncharacterized protein (TIGR02757 family)
MQGLKHLQRVFESYLQSALLKDFYLSDPIWFPKKFRDKNEIEVAAFVAAIFSLGPRYAIIRSLERIFGQFGESPYNSIRNFNYTVFLRRMDGHVQFAYKNITAGDIAQVLFALKEIMQRYGTIEDALRSYMVGDGKGEKYRVYNILIGLLEEMKNVGIPAQLGGKLSPRSVALLASPKQGSACKRMNMFLRWMTRKDEIDFGFYNWLGTDELVIPLDVNVSRAARKLKLTRRKTDDWKTAVEITNNLKKLDPLDPVKYDVPLFLYGIKMRKIASGRQ